ncbi:MAG TPA: NAD-dependent deacylase [Syntrophorhabdaceae bacterium]|nr:NAD-dependent deacylase [Syntrophorhabdaceae bacterium]
MTPTDRAVKALATTKFLLVITGAGISQESGVPTFRGKDGLWQNHRAEDLATVQAFERDPVTVWKWYDFRRAIISKADINPGHKAIKALEEAFHDFLLVTQNVDGLHARAGSTRMVEIHGNLWRVRCVRDSTRSMLTEVPLSVIPPLCACGALLRPDVVWFGESLCSDALDRAIRAVEMCDTLIVAGTSGVVYPVASFPEMVKHHDGFVIEINTEPTPLSAVADVSLYGRSAQILTELTSRLGL